MGENMIIKLLRFILGYVDFVAEGGFPDRFLNLCTKEEIPLWNIENIGGKIKASTTLKGYLRIKSPSKKSGMKTRNIKKNGLYFFLKRNKKRVGILFGIIIFTFIICILSQFVWSVQVVGNTTIETDKILDEFASYGVKVGAYYNKINLTEVADMALKNNAQYSWVAVNRKGTAIVIEVKESVKIPEMYDSETPTNVVAKNDGVILRMEVMSGNSEIKVGSAVRKGDLLISGIMKSQTGAEILIHADGFVKGLVKKHNKFNADDMKIYSVKNFGKKYSLYFFGLKIDFGKTVPKEYNSSHKLFIESKKTQLPVGIITEWGADYNELPENINDDTAKKFTYLCESIYVKDLLENAEIQNSKIIEKWDDTAKYCEIYAECVEEIGKIQEIYVEKTNDIA